MSRRSSRSSNIDSGEFFLECKAAYLSIFESIKEKIESEESLQEVLQQTGRNPSSKALRKYWTNDTDELSFDDFVDICRKEPITSADDLMKAFRKIDINGDGYISLEELHKILTSKGEKKSKSEVKKMIDEVDENKDGKLDYKEFCKMVISTTEESKKLQRKMMEKKERKKKAEIDKRGEMSGSQVSVKSAASTKKNATSKEDETVKENLEDEIGEECVTARSDSARSIKPSTSPRKSMSDSLTGQDIVSSRATLKEKNEEVTGSRPSLNKDDILLTSRRSSRPGSGKSRNSERGLASGSPDKLHGSQSSLQDVTGSNVSLTSAGALAAKIVQQNENATSKEDETVKENVEDEINEECVTARSESARSIKPSPSPRKSMSDSLTGQDIVSSRATLKEKNEEVTGSRPSLNKDDILLTSRRSSRPGSGRSRNSEKGLTTGSPDKLLGSQSSLQDVTASNVSLTSAGALAAKNVRQNVGTPSGSRKSSLLSIGDGSPPIPAQRKSLHTASYFDQDDLPKPSPRVKKDKARPAPATKSLKLDEPKNLREWTHTKSKGSFFLEDGSLICHQYDLNLPDNSKVWVTIQPLKNKDGNPVDTSVFILRDRPDEDGNLLVSFSEHRDGRGKYGVSCDLPAGKYSIMPYTTGCRFKANTSESSKEAKLVTEKDGKYVITKAFRKVLEEIFDYSDLDGNGFMSRKEFNLFNIRTSGEEVADDEWQVVEDRIDLEDGEITKAGFLQLNELEAEDSEGDAEDLWTTLTSMGYNKQLVMDQACPFQIDVYTEDCDDAELDVVKVDSYPTYQGDLSFEDVISKGFVTRGEISRVKGMKDLCLYTYINDGWASLVLDNKSHTRVRVEIDCNRSENVIGNHDSLQRTLRVDPGATVIAYHLMPEDDNTEWQIKCTETIR